MLYQTIKIEKIHSLTKEKILVDANVVKGIKFEDSKKITVLAIPKDLKNADYRDYIVWLESGKKPLPYDLKIQDRDENSNPIILYSEQELIDMTNQGSL